MGLDDNANVWQAIEKCPSGALTCQYRHDIDVRFEPDKNRSAAYDNDVEIGECEYSATDTDWSIYHTYVKPEYEGHGIAKRLVYAVIEQAERCKVDITTTCSYAKKIIEG